MVVQPGKLGRILKYTSDHCSDGRITPPPNLFSGLPGSPADSIESCLVIVEEQRHHIVIYIFIFLFLFTFQLLSPNCHYCWSISVSLTPSRSFLATYAHNQPRNRSLRAQSALFQSGRWGFTTRSRDLVRTILGFLHCLAISFYH